MLRAGAPSLTGLPLAARLHPNTATQLLSPARDKKGSSFCLGIVVMGHHNLQCPLLLLKHVAILHAQN